MYFNSLFVSQYLFIFTVYPILYVWHFCLWSVTLYPYRSNVKSNQSVVNLDGIPKSLPPFNLSLISSQSLQILSSARMFGIGLSLVSRSELTLNVADVDASS